MMKSLGGIAVILCLVSWGAGGEEPVTLRLGLVPARSASGAPSAAELAVFDAFRLKHPDYHFVYSTLLNLPEGMIEAQYMMAFAGGQGPDVFDMSIRQVQNYVRQGLVLPLDDLIAKERQKDPGWQLPMQDLSQGHWDAVRGEDGRLYGVLSNYWILTLWYRRDLFVEAGFDPPRPPKTWEEYFEFAQKLTFPTKRVRTARFQAGQYGTYIPTGYQAGYIFTNFVYTAGGDVTMQERTCPKDRTVNEYRKEDQVCLCRVCGQSLADEPRRWKLTYGREAGQRALAFYKRLRWTEWTRCPDCATPNDVPVAVCADCGEPNPVRPGTKDLHCRVCQRSLPPSPESNRFQCSQCGRGLRDAPVYTGVVRLGGDALDMFMRGEIAMMLNLVDPLALERALTEGSLRSDQIGFGPPPAEHEGGPHLALTGGRAWCISTRAANDPKVLEAAWQYLLFRCGDEAQRIWVDIMVRGGCAHLVRPQLLEKFGYTQAYEDYDPNFREAMEQAPRYGRVQPHDPYYQHVEATELAVPVDTIVYAGGQYRNPALVITESMQRGNSKYYGIVGPAVQRRRDLWATAVVLIAVPLVIAAFVYTLRQKSEVAEGALRTKVSHVVGAGAGRRRNTVIAWCLMMPALATVVLWQYVPLFRGTVMAFYDYKIYGRGEFLGLGNFIEILTSGEFWNSVLATIIYVTMSLGLGFVAPIALALLLHEVPKGKVLFRTVFYLPAVTTGLVIMFLWKMLYAPSSQGFLNRVFMPVLHFFHLVGPDVQYIDWLHTPVLAMLCVVVPGVWAGAGPGSLIYLAALKTVPEDLYEAISVDGGGIRHKLCHVLYPAIKPLILINFIGAFIGSFHAMQNVFVMTGGGPANSTRVLGIHIWANAFLYLRLGYATAMAWILGSILIGFTVLQLRMLKRMEFRASHTLET